MPTRGGTGRWYCNCVLKRRSDRCCAPSLQSAHAFRRVPRRNFPSPPTLRCGLDANVIPLHSHRRIVDCVPCLAKPEAGARRSARAVEPRRWFRTAFASERPLSRPLPARRRERDCASRVTCGRPGACTCGNASIDPMCCAVAPPSTGLELPAPLSIRIHDLLAFSPSP